MLHTEINGTHYFVDANWAEASAPVYAMVLECWDWQSEPSLGATSRQVADYGHREGRALKELIREDYIDAGCEEDLGGAWENCDIYELEFENGRLVSIDGEPVEED